MNASGNRVGHVPMEARQWLIPRTDATLWKTPSSWSRVGVLPAGEPVLQTGPMKHIGAHVMMPIAGGAVEWSLLRAGTVDDFVINRDVVVMDFGRKRKRRVRKKRTIHSPNVESAARVGSYPSSLPDSSVEGKELRRETNVFQRSLEASVRSLGAIDVEMEHYFTLLQACKRVTPVLSPELEELDRLYALMCPWYRPPTYKTSWHRNLAKRTRRRLHALRHKLLDMCPGLGCMDDVAFNVRGDDASRGIRSFSFLSDPPTGVVHTHPGIRSFSFLSDPPTEVVQTHSGTRSSSSVCDPLPGEVRTRPRPDCGEGGIFAFVEWSDSQEAAPLSEPCTRPRLLGGGRGAATPRKRPAASTDEPQSRGRDIAQTYRETRYRAWVPAEKYSAAQALGTELVEEAKKHCLEKHCISQKVFAYLWEDFKAIYRRRCFLYLYTCGSLML